MHFNGSIQTYFVSEGAKALTELDHNDDMIIQNGKMLKRSTKIV